MRNIFVLLVMLFSLCSTAQSAELFGKVDSLSGKAFVSDDATQWKTLSVGQAVYAGQTIATDDEGEVHIETEDGGIVAIRPDTEFRVDEYKAEGGSDDKVFMSLAKGALRSITGWIGKYNPSGYRVTTPTATIGIRGTDHEVTVIEETDGDEAGTYDVVNEGATLLKTRYGEREVTPEKFAFAPRYRAVAPVFLARKPMFWGAHKLAIEGLIKQRKESLRERIMQMREDRIKAVHEKRVKELKKKQIREPREKRVKPREAIREKHSVQSQRKQSSIEGRKPAQSKQRPEAVKQRPIVPPKENGQEAPRNGGKKADRVRREQPQRPENKNKNR